MFDSIFGNLPAVDLSEVEERVVECGRNGHIAGFGQQSAHPWGHALVGSLVGSRGFTRGVKSCNVAFDRPA